MSEYRNHGGVRTLSPYFMIHLSAMTGEDLHDKSEIAEELAYRDQQIAKLKAEREQLIALAKFGRDALDSMVNYGNDLCANDLLPFAEDLGLFSETAHLSKRCDNHCECEKICSKDLREINYLVETPLASLPEGIE